METGIAEKVEVSKSYDHCSICGEAFGMTETKTLHRDWKGYGIAPPEAIVHIDCVNKRSGTLVE